VSQKFSDDACIGAAELAGARAPPQFLTAGARGHNIFYGAPVKIERLMNKPNIQQRKWSACHPLATDTLPLINSFVHHTVFYFGADSSHADTASVRRHPVSQSGKRNTWINPLFCSRLDSL